MINITHISNSIGKNKGGGIKVVVINYMKYQNIRKFNINLWFPGSNDLNKELEKYKEFGSRVKLLGLIGISNDFKQYLPKIFKDLKKIDIVHQHSLWMPISILTLYFSKILNKKVIIQPHGTLAPAALKRSSIKKKIVGFIYENSNLKNSSVIVASSVIELNDVKRKFPNKKVALIPHGVSRKFMSKLSVKYPHYDKIFGEKEIILFVSRIHPIKGLDRLIEAVSKIDKAKLKNYIFAIAGDGDDIYINVLKNMITQKKLEQYFIFLGYLNEDKKIALMDKSKCFILPSITENFSISIVEAMSRGLPVVTTKGTPWSEIEENKCGFWVDNSVNGILNGIISVITLSDKQIIEIGKNARELVQSSYLLEDNISKYDELYYYLETNKSKPSFIF